MPVPWADDRPLAEPCNALLGAGGGRGCGMIFGNGVLQSSLFLRCKSLGWGGIEVAGIASSRFFENSCD